jgi:concanavalin A-like lectin/glucanase superfamily protein
MILWDCNQSVFCQTVLYNGSNPTQTGTYFADYAAAKSKWTLLAGTYDGQNLIAYADAIAGSGGTLAVTEDPVDINDTAKIGTHGDLSGPFAGQLDEVRISRVARSQAYFEASRRAANDSSISFGDELPNQ